MTPCTPSCELLVSQCHLTAVNVRSGKVQAACVVFMNAYLVRPKPFPDLSQRVPLFKGPGPKNHTLNGLWDQSPPKNGYLDPPSSSVNVPAVMVGTPISSQDPSLLDRFLKMWRFESHQVSKSPTSVLRRLMPCAPSSPED